MEQQTQPIICVKNLNTRFGDDWVHHNLNVTFNQGKIITISGNSGCGKTTLVHRILMLDRIEEGGDITLWGQSVSEIYDHPKKRRELAARLGMMFQGGALFNGLSVLENVMFPLNEYTDFSESTMKMLAGIKIKMAGLSHHDCMKYPSDLSGGMIKRAALARTLALDPQVVFLDEPSAGLDPQASKALGQLILKLKKDLSLTVIMITHDVDLTWQVSDEFVYLADQQVLIHDTVANAAKSDYLALQRFFNTKNATNSSIIGTSGHHHD